MSATPIVDEPRPVRYEPGFEREEENEAETAAQLAETLRGIIDTTKRDYGHAVRSVHAKSHGILAAELVVPDDLPERFRQGLFAKAGTYPVVMRFSTNPGDILDDSVTVPRGLAVKVIGVAGERLPGGEKDNTQDFVLVNAPAFSAPDAKTFLKSLKLLAATTDQPQGLKKIASAVLRGVETVVEAVGGESPTAKTLGGHPSTHILGETFFSQVPFLYGPFIAKFAIAPVSPGLLGHQDETLATSGRPNAIRDALREHFARDGGEWEVRAQLLTDPETMPIEDASVEWPQGASPYVTVARIRAAPQDGWSEERSRAVDDGLAFSVWHGLADHRPLGSINRVRRPVYEVSANHRSKLNRCPIHEPASGAEAGI